MQIVRSLAGYTLGRSDLVRRAMSKKKTAVMEQERKNFVYGNEAEGVPGCISKGIDEETAKRIFNSMMDFAKYAFNKSHAAAYAVVSYQTAYLKYYYPVEFMAALLTSVIDNPPKVSAYIMAVRQMGIAMLPPDVNEGEWEFSVTDKGIRYALSAIKNVGKNFVDHMVEERRQNGPFNNLKNFIERMYGQDLNRRILENLIKAGALDSLGGTRKQFIQVYGAMLDAVMQEKKTSMSGQMSLFDMMQEEDKKEYEVQLPPVGEFEKETLLGYEKEVLGIYISGHPLQEYERLWKKSITNYASDFMLDEETGNVSVHDGQTVVVGGMITARRTLVTKKNQMMAFITVEDLLGSVEVLVFPREYERCSHSLEVDAKVFVKGRVSAEDEKDAKILCEKITPFDKVSKELWLKFATKDEYASREKEILEVMRDSEGDDEIIIYIADGKLMKRLPKNQNIHIDDGILAKLRDKLGEENVKVR